MADLIQPVDIELGGVMRHLKYGFRAMKAVESLPPEFKDGAKPLHMLQGLLWASSLNQFREFTMTDAEDLLELEQDRSEEIERALILVLERFAQHKKNSDRPPNEATNGTGENSGQLVASISG